MKHALKLCLFLLFPFIVLAKPHPIKTKVVIGYVEGYRGLINIDMISPMKVTHLNYAFVDVQNNRAWLHREATDTVNFRKLVALKKVNPALKVLISIGGWTWSGNFSDAVLTDTTRKAFAESAVALVGKYHLDGIDIDWEYPNLKGAGNIHQPEDKENYTLLFRDIRHGLDSLQKITSTKYLLSTAVGAFPDFIKNTDMGKAQQYLDYINLMAYDYLSNPSGHHANLYPGSTDVKENSADKAVTIFEAAGVPAGKLVMGIPFYGRGWSIEPLDKKARNKKMGSQFRTGGYTAIKDSLVQLGFKTYWDSKAKAPYLFNASTKQWVSLDNERSVKLKCRYVKQHNMGGVMFWEYSSDKKEYLLNVINKSLR